MTGNKKLKLSLKYFSRSRHQLCFIYEFDDLTFSTSYWYDNVNFYSLEKQYSKKFMEKIYFHITAYDINKLASLKPGIIDFGPFNRFCTESFKQLWLYTLDKVWAVWRYTNNFPYYKGPEFTSNTNSSSYTQTVSLQSPSEKVLNYCGGGKDSLVLMKLLEHANIPHASFSFSHSIYGKNQLQHQLLDHLLDHCELTERHRAWVYDDFLDSPTTSLYPEFQVQKVIAAETITGIFSALPVVLQYAYQQVVLACERSAEDINLVWKKTGESINYIWGKSGEAETLFNEYVKKELITNVNYFSALRPIHDVIIFNLLRRDSDILPFTHSCNTRKPWCMKCSKCAYVWLGFMAYLPTQKVDAMFQKNLFDIEENLKWYTDMLGIKNHKPFDCIGEIDEVRLAFALCRAKGLKGKAMDLFNQHFPYLNIEPLLEKYLRIGKPITTMPEHFIKALNPQFQKAAQDCHEYVANLEND